MLVKRQRATTAEEAEGQSRPGCSQRRSSLNPADTIRCTHRRRPSTPVAQTIGELRPLPIARQLHSTQLRIDSYVFWVYAALVLAVYTQPINGNWLYLAVSGGSTAPLSMRASSPSSYGSVEEHCRRTPGLNEHQREICRQQPYTLPSIGYGAVTAIIECQWQFKYERWNCSLRTAINDTEVDVLGSTLRSGNKENGFISAITSAGIVHAITQGCSKGNLSDCGCDNRYRGGQAIPVEQQQRRAAAGSSEAAEGVAAWRWGGCSDNVAYGIKFSKQFLDRYEKEQWRTDKDIKHLVDVHNHGVGREAVQRLMRKQCRCHGVSGSCEFKTCWQQMPKFAEVGDVLKKRYDKFAVQVLRRAKKRLRRKDKEQRKIPITANEIVYVNRSPNYCNADAATGIPGTTDRQCNATSYGSDSCDLLCCGRGFNTRVETRRERCHCKFVWCCEVKCKTCESRVQIHTCK